MPTGICSSGRPSTTSPARQLTMTPDNNHKVYNVNTFVDINTSADVKGLQILVHEKGGRQIGINGLITHFTYNLKLDTCTWMSSPPAINTCTWKEKEERREDDVTLSVPCRC
jgi:hypothetical protein